MTGREHGRPKYVFERCRCQVCCQANREYLREYKQARARLGKDRTVRLEAAATRGHLLALARQGVGPKKIAAVSGVSTHTLASILSGETATVTPDTERRVLAVTAERARTAESRVDITPTLRRVRQLNDLGYSNAWIARALGYTGTGLQFRGSTIRQRNAKAIADLRSRIGDLPYDALHDMTLRDPSLLSLQLADVIEETRRRLQQDTVVRLRPTATPEGWVAYRDALLGR